MKGRFLALSVWSVSLVLGINGPLHADSLPMRGVTDSRIRTVLYSPDDVYRLYGFVGYALDLEFASDEVFVGLSAGDPEALDRAKHERRNRTRGTRRGRHRAGAGGLRFRTFRDAG